MKRKAKVIDFEGEAADELQSIRDRIGKEVPLSRRYTQGAKALLVSLEGETATIRFPNGAILTQVPLRDLVDDSGYWKPYRRRE
jgi:hypothetical protein